MSDITKFSAVKLTRKIRRRELSPVEVTDAYLARIEKCNPKLNAIVTLTADAARDAAKRAEQDVMSGKSLPPLHGVPVTVKDCFDTAGVRTTWGSKMRADMVPTEDATLVKRLKAAGCIVLGKTNVPEFAMSQFTDNILFGPTRNPYRADRSVGGSSGGEAAALASRMSPLGIGSDIGGSLRIPAHCCGIVSIRPTQGRCPMTGHMMMGPAYFGTMAAMGPMARNVADVALLLTILEGPDDADPFCQPFPATNPKLKPRTGLRVGILDLSDQCPVAEDVQRAVRQAADVLASDGGRVEKVEDPALSQIFQTWLTLMSFGFKDLTPEVVAHREMLDPRFAMLLDLPAPEPMAFLQADLLRAGITMAFIRFYREHDVILAPVLTSTAPIGDQGPVVNGEPQQLVYAAMHTYASVLTGDPAAVVPVANGEDGLPIGVQIHARRGNDTLAL
ncbi:MAG: hypothetical protein A2Y95_08700, partial [Deltaproteobacteria bacterium RBG_13_65_10]